MGERILPCSTFNISYIKYLRTFIPHHRSLLPPHTFASSKIYMQSVRASRLYAQNIYNQAISFPFSLTLCLNGFWSTLCIPVPVSDWCDAHRAIISVLCAHWIPGKRLFWSTICFFHVVYIFYVCHDSLSFYFFSRLASAFEAGKSNNYLCYPY